MTSGLTRRGFLAGGVIASIGAAGVLTGCGSSLGADGSSMDTQGEDAVQIPESFDEELDCDILVIGAGASGLTAATDAAENGKTVICLESQEAAGGDEVFVEGVFGVDSKMQLEQGIEVNTGGIVRSELEEMQYRVDGGAYVDLVKNSGENIDWLIEHGVQFQQVDGYWGPDQVFHWFPINEFGRGVGAEGFVAPMVAAAEAAGVQFYYQTAATALIQSEEGKVVGAYAESDELVYKINASAVILATGAYAGNDEYLKEVGAQEGSYMVMALPGHDGMGHKMAIACGAASNISNSAFIGGVEIPGMKGFFEGGAFSMLPTATPSILWLDNEGSRFVNEDFALSNLMLAFNPRLWRDDVYAFLDQGMMDAYVNGDDAAAQELSDGIDTGSFLKADTFDELAEAMGANPDMLSATVERYNESCAAGVDRDFGKAKEFLVEIGDGPYYAAKLGLSIATPVGSIKTNRDFNAITPENEPINGLYVVGVEGCMLFANVYTVGVSGVCNANNINSARTAVRHALANCF